MTFGAIVWIIRKSIPSGSAGGGGPGGIFSLGKSPAKLFNKMTDVNVKFDEVAGMDEAKEEIMEFVKFLKDPKNWGFLGHEYPEERFYQALQVLGKTLIAKAAAGEVGPFYSMSTSEFIEMFAGVGASQVSIFI